VLDIGTQPKSTQLDKFLQIVGTLEILETNRTLQKRVHHPQYAKTEKSKLAYSTRKKVLEIVRTLEIPEQHHPYRNSDHSA
jgi:hypothetical protein